jgi:hypothetical protein
MMRASLIILALVCTSAHAVSTIKPPPPWQAWIDAIKKPWNAGGRA